MPCIPFRGPDGFSGFVCTRANRAARCSVPGCDRPRVALCDYPVTRDGHRATCDAPLCASHRHHQQGRDIDYCPAHARATTDQGGSR